MPADVFAKLDRVPSLDGPAEQVKAGLTHDRERMVEARACDDFYQCKNERHFKRRTYESDEDFRTRPRRFSRLLRVAIRKLSEPLYSPGPTRQWEGSEPITAELESIYEQTQIDVRMASADRAATIGHVSAVQVEATGEPEKPVRLWVWKAHEFTVWTRDGDPTTPWAVCTVDTIPERAMIRTRARLWSAAELRTYVSEPYAPGGDMLRRCEHLVEQIPSPYLGVLPFVFVRNEPPDSLFWEGGIGSPLREANVELDQRLSDLANHVRAFLDPMLTAKNLAPGTVLRPGTEKVTHLPSDPNIRAGDMKGEPTLQYLQAQMGVQDAWFDAKTAADQYLEDLEVPLTVVRSDASTDLSGIALERKTAPLLHRTRARQPQFGETEGELAAKILAVTGTWYGRQDLVAAAQAPALVCVWPEPRVLDTTNLEGLQTLQAELDMGFTDPFEALARLRGITLGQAKRLAAEIAERRDEWRELMGDVSAVDAAQSQATGESNGQGKVGDGEDPGAAGAEPEPSAAAGGGGASDAHGSDPGVA
jgi:hypothetical protein